MDLDFNNMIPELHYYIHRKCTSNWKIEGAVTPFIDITYITAGKAKYIIGEQEYLVKKGDLLCIPKNSYRAAVTVPGNLMECYTTNFFLRNQQGEDISLPLPLISHIGTVSPLISRFHEIHNVWLQQDFGYMLRVRAILCLILYQVLSLLLNENHLNQADPRIKNSVQYLSTHYAEPLTIDMLADQFGLHPVYFGNLFHNAMNVTFRQYLTSLRLNSAENLLKCGEYSVGDVAVMCGFSDIFYFSRLFKEMKGISPSKLLPKELKKSR